MPRYLLDANIFIESHQRQYGMDFCPAFWTWLTLKNDADVVFSIDKVRAELTKFDDDLCRWAKEQTARFFVESESETVKRLPDVASWAQEKSNPSYKPAAISRFFSSADLHLVSYASAAGCHIVTQEVPAPRSSASVKIPDACKAFSVECISLWDLLRAEGAKFVLAP